MFGAHGSATPGHSRPHSRPLRLTNYAPKSQTILPANFYPSNNTLIQALLVLLITNMISMGKTWSDLLKLCAASSSSPPLSKLSLLPGTRIGPQKVIFGHFAFFFGIFTSFSRERGPFFSNAIPLIKINFFWVKLFSPGFLMYRPSWTQSILLIWPILALGPHPTAHLRQRQR